MNVYICDPCGLKNSHNDSLPFGWFRLSILCYLDSEVDARVVHLCPSCAHVLRGSLHYLGGFLQGKVKEFVRAP